MCFGKQAFERPLLGGVAKRHWARPNLSGSEENQNRASRSGGGGTTQNPWLLGLLPLSGNKPLGNSLPGARAVPLAAASPSGDGL